MMADSDIELIRAELREAAKPPWVIVGYQLGPNAQRFTRDSLFGGSMAHPWASVVWTDLGWFWFVNGEGGSHDDRFADGHGVPTAAIAIAAADAALERCVSAGVEASDG